MDKIPLGLLFAYTAKLLILGASFADAPIMLVLGAAASLFEFKKDKRIDNLQKEIKNLSNRLEKSEQELGDFRSYLTGTKLSQAFKK